MLVVARALAAKDEAGFFDVLGDPLVRSRSVAFLIPQNLCNGVLERLPDLLMRLALPEQVVRRASDPAYGAEIVVDDIGSHEPVRRPDTASNHGIEGVPIEAVGVVNRKRITFFRGLSKLILEALTSRYGPAPCISLR